MNRCLVCFLPLYGVARKRYCSERCKLLKRPFRVWDGEGKTICEKHPSVLCECPDVEKRHLFILLSCTDGINREYIADVNGLSTKQCLEFLTRERTKAINVWFSFGYDVNKILEDIPLDRSTSSRFELWTEGRTRWKRWRLEYTPRKTFQVCKDGRMNYSAADSFGFFQMSFLKACKQMGIDTSRFEKGKEERSNFGTWSIADILHYNYEEMEALLELMNRLRDAFYKADIMPAYWYGPGAVAASWLKKYAIDDHYAEHPDRMHRAIMHAYFGGRIDISCVGEAHVYKHDIASAYPAAICDLISLANVRWEYALLPQLDTHGLYHVSWKIARGNNWGPFPWRNHRGVVMYPYEGEGWYWGIEVAAAQRLYPGCITILGAWIPYGEKTYPMRELVQRDYEKRAELKRKKDATNIAFKLSLNSLYGKTAQHTARYGKPRWQNYIWAGYITAWTRAKILDAMLAVGPENVVTVATDGMFTLAPIPGAEAQDDARTATLGAWQDEGYGPALITAPGLYATFRDGKAQVYKSRGMPAALNFGHVLRKWGCATTLNTEGADSETSVRDTFVGMGKALHTSAPCGIFMSESRTLQDVTIFGTSKRFPSPFMAGHEGWDTFDLWPKPRGEKVISYPYHYREEFDERAEKE